MMSLQELSDREEIRQLTTLYCYCIDRGDAEGYAGVFTEDGVVDCSEMGTPDMVGRPAMVEVVNAFVAFHQSYAHFVTNHGFHSIGADEAEGWCYFCLIGVTRAGDDTFMIGRYEDRYARTGEGWRIRRRKLIPHGPIEMSYVLPEPA